MAISGRGWVTRGDIMLRQRRYYAAAEAILCCGEATKEPPAGPETPVGWELEQVHAAQRAEQSEEHKPLKLQSTQVFFYQALAGLCPAELVRVRVRVQGSLRVRVRVQGSLRVRVRVSAHVSSAGEEREGGRGKTTPPALHSRLYHPLVCR